ncbi:MAG: hypothetical protein HQM10_13370 [Candidatus Riflebacteria bacterium]|nr:hypothetical protein [Candidatus Riflebacteria bacterium]
MNTYKNIVTAFFLLSVLLCLNTPILSGSPFDDSTVKILSGNSSYSTNLSPELTAQSLKSMISDDKVYVHNCRKYSTRILEDPFTKLIQGSIPMEERVGSRRFAWLEQVLEDHGIKITKIEHRKDPTGKYDNRTYTVIGREGVISPIAVHYRGSVTQLHFYPEPNPLSSNQQLMGIVDAEKELTQIEEKILKFQLKRDENLVWFEKANNWQVLQEAKYMHEMRNCDRAISKLKPSLIKAIENINAHLISAAKSAEKENNQELAQVLYSMLRSKPN